MTYRRIEQAILGFGALVILGSVFLLAPRGVPTREALLGQALLFLVLLAAARDGRRGGLIAAMAAAVAYVFVSLPVLRASQPGSAEMLSVIARLLVYGVVGIVGGEFFTRLRYNLATLEGSSALDEWSRVYNQRYLHAALSEAIERHERYGEPVSVVVITISEQVFAGVSPTRQRTLVRGVGDYLRGGVRVVDLVARLDDGRFAVLLPHTPGPGGYVVAFRTGAGVGKLLGTSPESVTARSLTLPDDTERLLALLDSIAPIEGGDADQSGA